MKKIKNSIRLFIITALLLLIFQVPAFAETGKSTASNVRIRKSASTESEVIDLLGVGDVVEILGKEGDWYKVSFKGNTGYVSQSFISVNNSGVASTANLENETNNQNDETNNKDNENSNEGSEPEINQDPNILDKNLPGNSVSTNKVYKVISNTQVSILPTITSESIGEIKENDEVTLINNAGLWAYIKSQNINGWVRIDKLSVKETTVGNATNENNESNNNENNTDNNVQDNNQDSNQNSNNNENNNNGSNENNNVNNNESDSNKEVNNSNGNSDTNPNNVNTNTTDTNNADSNANIPNNNANASETNNTNEPQVSYTPKIMYAKSAAVNIRSQSNTNSEVVASIALNADVRVVGEENGWYKIEVNGKSGYIRSDLLSNEKTAVTSRNNNLDRNATAQKESTVTVSVPNGNVSKTTTSQSVPVSSSGVTGNDVAAYAKQFLGCSYVYGAAGPKSFDCSGLTMYVYKHFGYSLSHSSKVQATQGVAVSGDLQPGDILIFSNDGKTVGHVGLYLGNDKFIHASTSTTGVIISNLHDKWNISKYWGARRIL